MKEVRGLGRVKAILFDMDGVLVESSRAWFYTLNSILGDLKLPKVSWEVFLKHLGQNINRDIEVFFKGFTVEEVTLMYEKRFPKFISLVDPMPYAKDVLIKLKEFGLKTGCVTNTQRALAIKILKRLGLLDFLGIVVGGDEVRCQKPDPEPILKALSILDVPPERACFVGDTVYDIEAANRAGCIPIGFRVEFNIKIDSLEELIWVLGLR